MAATDKSFMRELFLQHLPANVRMVLASAGDDVTCTPEKLAALADKVMEVTTAPTTSPAVCAIPQPTASPTDKLITELGQLREEVAHLRKLVQSS